MSPPGIKEGSELSDTDEEGPRKRIKLFASANEVEDGGCQRPRRIEGLHQLDNFELLGLRNIVVECSTALGGSLHPDPEVVEHLLDSIFNEGWASWKPIPHTSWRNTRVGSSMRICTLDANPGLFL
ncbi:hypothetical protein HYQ46_011464 [Verticillium longisporum]|nr:hypothetical protein HYQ44_017156 [Verticillium longisporum]KAG7112726.1 hypothetical protein HYQ46_011464 [Verticillium longisporum]